MCIRDSFANLRLAVRPHLASQINISEYDEQVSRLHAFTLADVDIDHTAFTGQSALERLECATGTGNGTLASEVRAGVHDGVFGQHDISGDLARSSHRARKRTLGRQCREVDLVKRHHDVSQFHRLATLNDASESVIRLTHDDLDLSNLEVVRSEIRLRPFLTGALDILCRAKNLIGRAWANSAFLTFADIDVIA